LALGGLPLFGNIPVNLPLFILGINTGTNIYFNDYLCYFFSVNKDGAISTLAG
jgi:hypothetical protein